MSEGKKERNKFRNSVFILHFTVCVVFQYFFALINRISKKSSFGLLENFNLQKLKYKHYKFGRSQFCDEFVSPSLNHIPPKNEGAKLN